MGVCILLPMKPHLMTRDEHQCSTGGLIRCEICHRRNNTLSVVLAVRIGFRGHFRQVITKKIDNEKQ